MTVKIQQKNRIPTYAKASAGKPKLRFAGFLGEWEEKKLGEIKLGSFNNGVFNDPSKVGSGYRLINVKDMYVGSEINVESLTKVELSKEEFAKNKANIGDIFFTRSSLVKEGIAYSNILTVNYDDVTFDGHIIRMIPNVKIIFPKFLAKALKIHNIRRQLVARGKTATMTTIGQEDLSSVKASFPSIPEQQKIAEFLGSVDGWIENLRKQKKSLEKYKKGMMQKIFSQEIRFKDDDGKNFSEWEKNRLSDICDIRKGKQLNRAELSMNVGHPVINGGMSPSGYTDTWNTTDNTIVISEGGNSCGYVSLIKEKFWCGGHCYALKLNKDIELNFAYQMLKFLEKKIMRLRVGSGLPNIQKKDIEKLKLNVPNFVEQQKIAEFLTSIDNLIESKQQQIAQAEQWKKGLMQGLFV